MRSSKRSSTHGALSSDTGHPSYEETDAEGAQLNNELLGRTLVSRSTPNATVHRAGMLGSFGSFDAVHYRERGVVRNKLEMFDDAWSPNNVNHADHSE